MRNQRFKTIRLLLKLMLLFQIFSHHCFKAEATENNSTECFDIKCKVGKETGLNDQISNKDAGLSVAKRAKRPAHLIPLKLLRGKEKNKAAISNTRFYGPAKSCEELLKMGYTRNGFYLVKGNATSNKRHVEIVDCLFANPSGVKEVKEKRIGFIYLNTSLIKSNRRRSIETFLELSVETFSKIEHKRSKRPGRLIPLQLLNVKEEENIPKPFYGPPTNCSDLEMLGYTLNGYYLVNASHSSGTIEVVLCRFQLSPINNEAAMEERLGFISLNKNTVFMGQLKSFDNKTKATTKKSRNNPTLKRKIRPVRLIPPKRIFEGERRNYTEEQTVQRINSNPANCSDIGKLGYTLNGFYIVNGSDNAGRFGVVFCQFMLFSVNLLPWTYKTSKEERFGIISSHSLSSLTKPMKRKHNTTFDKLNIFKTVSVDASSQIQKVNEDDEERYLLKNKRNKCMSSKKLNHDGSPWWTPTDRPHETECDPKDEYQYWKWCGNQNICNHFGKLLSKEYLGTSGGPNIKEEKLFFISLMGKDEPVDYKIDQTWRLTDVGQLVDSKDGLCLGLAYTNFDRSNAKLTLRVDSCDMKERGQFWSFVTV